MASSARHTTGRAALIALVVALAIVAAVSTFASDGSETSTAPFSFETAALVSLAAVVVVAGTYYAVRYLRAKKD